MDTKYAAEPEAKPKAKVPQLYAETTPSNHLDSLDRARETGRIFLWVSIGAAIVWLIAAFGTAAGLIGSDGRTNLPMAGILVGSLAIAIPGLMIVMAGLLAQENARASATNAVVLEAAARLLSPLETGGREARTFADEMKTSAAAVDRAMAHALSSMKAMSGEIADERQRLESVSYVTADNARDLSERLAKEREALESIAADIREQTEAMSEAIPRQAAQMRDSARQAASDLSEADRELESRLDTLNQASAALTSKVSSLDEMSIEAAKRSEELVFAVERMETKLQQSRTMVDQALRASEMVAASAATTGDRITEAVADALEHARTASVDIQSEATEAAEKAALSIAALKQAGAEAADAIRAAKAEADVTMRIEPSASQPVATEPAENDAPSASVSTPPNDPALRPGFSYSFADDTSGKSVPQAEGSTENSGESDMDLFESPNRADTDSEDGQSAVSDSTEHAPGTAHDGSEDKAEADQTPPRWTDRMPSYLKPVGGTDLTKDASGNKSDDEDESEERAAGDDRRQNSQHWRDIIADMERDDHTTLPREENAEGVIDGLQRAGVRLGEIFRPRDKKRIASAARKGEGLRRKAIADSAARHVQRVQSCLDEDRELMTMAREFLVIEEPDALMALEKTSHSSKNASARLSAFLLIDAALG
ncbi:AAA family ATPase [Henriciella litoralis]|uniref:hypothetical protein n=1 Tax=Henriciella litoralis TaxID=568102 RepID=UPI000A00302E|nr:hypothetical protein [Henriciella litoralis]